MKNKITYKRPVPIMKFIFGAAFFILGISWLPHIFGFVICGLSFFFVHTTGIEIDLENRKYRKTVSFFSLAFGKWQELPNIDYVSVFKTSETTTVRALSAEANVNNEVIKLNLFYNTNQKIEAYNTQSEKDAFEKAKQIATILKIDILDATERESKWL
ncbi:hypothetical protein [Winogradskyella sp. MIT101101]|uniref:hypothetical protein n=1 Tax=Winogradskyella sp. MIT101101 TaxID=3098297 RepID=UPI0039999B13